VGGAPEGWPRGPNRERTRDRLAQRRQYVQLWQHHLLTARRQVFLKSEGCDEELPPAEQQVLLPPPLPIPLYFGGCPPARRNPAAMLCDGVMPTCAGIVTCQRCATYSQGGVPCAGRRCGTFGGRGA